MEAAHATGREYLRVSKDKTGRGASPDEQHDENVPFAASFGVTLGEPYRDDNRSASRYATKSRKAFDRLVADLESGAFTEDFLVLWESSRGSRKVLEWVLLLDLLEQRGKRVLVTTHNRMYDPRVPRDRRSLLEDAVDSEYESAKTHERTTRSRESSAALGRPHGRMPFGYKAIFDERTGKSLGRVPDPGNAEIVRELFDRVVRGHSLRSIAIDFGRRGIEKMSGGPFSPAHLRSMLRNRCYVGDRIWIQGRRSGWSKENPVITKGNWEPIVEAATWLAVQRILDDPTRRKSKPGKGKHLLSMIARCGVCQDVLNVATIVGRERYRCRSHGHLTILKQFLDEPVEERIIEFMSDPDQYRVLAVQNGDEDALKAATQAVEEVRLELDELGDQVGSGALSPALAARAEPGIRKRLGEAEQRLRSLQVPSRLAGLLEPGPDVAKRWHAALMPTRREVARLLLVPEVMGAVHVMPATKAGIRVPHVDRIVMVQETK